MDAQRIRHPLAGGVGVSAILAIVLHCAPAPRPRPAPPPPRVTPSGPETASWVTLPAFVMGQLCGNFLPAAGWYRFRLFEPGRVTIDLQGERGASDLDLTLYDEQLHLLVHSASTSSTENIGQDLAAGLYYVKVDCFARKANTRYTLEIRVRPRRPELPPPSPSIDEPKSHATLIHESSKSPIGAAKRYLSRWYKYNVAHTGTIKIHFRPDVVRGALTFQIIDDNNRVVGESTSSIEEKIITAAARAGTYHFHILTTSPATTTGRYSFDIEFIQRKTPPPPPSPITHVPPQPVPRPQPPPTPAEPPRSSPIELPRGRGVSIAVGGQTEPPARWYTFAVATESHVTVAFSGSGHVSAAVYRRNEATPLKKGKSGGQTVINENYSAGTYDVRVAGSAAARGTLRLEVNEKSRDAGFTKKEH